MDKTDNTMGLWSRLLLLLGCLMVMTTAQADLKSLFGSGTANNDFLSVDEAFQLEGTYDGQNAVLYFTVTPEYYLYKDRFRFKADSTQDTLGSPEWPDSVLKYDQFQEQDVQVFTEDFSLALPLVSTATEPLLTVTYQGCAEAGLCYPPKTVTLALSRISAPAVPVSTVAVKQEQASPFINKPVQTTTEEKPAGFSLFSDTSLFATLAGFFLAGILLSLTPCVLPMVPILSSIIVGAGEASRKRMLLLTICYILGMAAMFTLAGVLTGLFGASLNLQAQLQSPWVLIPFAILFVIFSLSMFGLYELQLPAFLRDKLENKANKQQGGSLSGALLLGVFSSLVVSPCVSAPLAGALVYISTTGNALLGGSALFSLALGMGFPLLLIGIGGSQLIPKAGNWMNGVRAAFGVLLLAVALWLIERLIPASLSVFLWGCLFTGSGIYLGALNFTGLKGFAALRQTIGIILLVIGASQLIGALKGAEDPLQPLATAEFSSVAGSTAPVSSELVFHTITDPAELQTELVKAQQQGRVAMVDFYADWCISCKIMERELFPKPEVKSQLDKMYLIRADITANTAAQQTLLSRYQLFGPPSLIFFSKEGEEQPALRIQGEPDLKQLANTLRKATEL
ncbi:protein-disulfide reductase DsbD [Endozoicomonadaceae bacterium StTr2]